MIPDEPVRGRTPPPWFHALSGIDRVRAFSQGLLPWPPSSRLFGMRTTHVVPGAVTVVMPAAESSMGGGGQLETIPVMVAALEGASLTALPAGVGARPLSFSFNPFRPAYARPGNMLARARVLHSSSMGVFAEVHLEDPEGRHLAHGTLQTAVPLLEPPPPSPPEEMTRVEEPVYETPDPYLRSLPSSSPRTALEQEDGLTLLRKWADGSIQIPIMSLYDIRFEEIEEGKVSLSIPASEWFCSLSSEVSPGVIAALGNMTGWLGALTLHRLGWSIVWLDSNVRFLRLAAADGRRLGAETCLTERIELQRKDGLGGGFCMATTIRDADGKVVAIHSAAFARVDAAQRSRQHRREARRVLATLLFTDIVESTKHAERLGDARWRSLLEEHRLGVRKEISRHNGTEVDTAGDGFFVRFESPAQAIAAARAAQHATASLGIQLRAGIHTGECELEGNKPAGMAVHIAARIQSLAQGDEILVSSIVKELAMGSDVRFADRGEHELKDVPDRWRLYAVVD